jgi:hypothetical protein
MRSVIHLVTSLFTLMQSMPCFAEPANEQHQSHRSPEPAFVAGTALDSGTLDLYRAGAEVRNSIRPEGLVAGNAANNVITGMNSIREGAFANANGLPVVIQNSGSNVLIQNATIVNIQLK